MMFSPDQIKAAIEALTKGDGKAALEILEALLVAAATGGESGSTPPPPADAGATAGNADPPVPADDKNAPPAAEMSALSRGVLAVLGMTNPGAALEKVRALKAEADKLETDRVALEKSERRSLVAELVKLGVEFPATAWEDTSAEGDARVPCARLSAEPLADMRKRVGLIRTTRKPADAGGHTPPAGSGTTDPTKLGEADLSKEELAKANEIKDPKARERFVSLRLSRRAPKA